MTNQEGKESSTFEQDDNFINIVCASRRLLTKEDVIDQFRINTDEWEVEKFEVKSSEGYRKDRKVKWQVEGGQVIHGDVDDSGKMLVVPLYHIRVRLKRRTKDIQNRNIVQDLISDAKAFAPTYPKIEYATYKDGYLYELGMPDVHFGRETWCEESGGNYDINLAEKALDSVLNKLLSYGKGFKISKILFPLGNDFFNVEGKSNATAHGTPQQEDTRAQKTFRRGREILIAMIDKCATIAPVDVLIIPGNHDTERSFYLGESLECWYHANPNVHVDNRVTPRKYYSYGVNLIGLTHGYFEKLDKLPMLMAIEEPKLWAKSKYREIHTGDKHNKKDIIYAADEGPGVVVRILRSLAVTDAWTFNKGYKSLRAAEAFLWHPTDGLSAQFTALP